MEINIETAIRICPNLYNVKDVVCVEPNVYNNSIHLCNSYSYPFNYVLPTNCSQSSVFSTTVEPLLNYLFEGCDVSIVTFGQSRSGKSYTLIGPGVDCALSESEYGIIPRFLREVFSSTSQNNKNYLVHITWTQICGENVQDLLGMGSVECRNVSDAFELLQLGMSNITGRCTHTLFTVTLEQQWILDGVVQHKVSTASFVDLSGCEKLVTMDNNGLMQSLPVDTGVLTLQRCVWALTESYNLTNNLQAIPYNQSALTMLLKDSFGGRAKTLLICCISPVLSDFVETFYSLQFALKAQMIKNFVTVNAYTTCDIMHENIDLFGLQFATNQLFQLVVNAEDLFKKLILNGSLSKSQLEQISQWLTLKQECEDCISESSERPRSLEIIEEATEDLCETASEESEAAYENDHQNTSEHVEEMMQNFYAKTDSLISSINEKSSPNSIAKGSYSNSYNEYHLKGARGRRGSIHSADDFFPLHKSSTSKILEESLNQTSGIDMEVKKNLNYNTKQKILNHIRAEIEGYEKQINEIELTIQMKEKLMQQLLKHKNTRTNARGKLKQKYKKLQNELQIVRSKLLQAKLENDHCVEQKCYSEMSEIEKKLQDAENVKDITEDGAKTIVELESSLSASKKHLEKLKRIKQKEENLKLNFENELIDEKKRNSQNQIANKSDTNDNLMVKRCSITASSSSNSMIKKNSDSGSLEYNEKVESLKHEIKELRKIRDHLLDHKCRIGIKLQNRKLMDEFEEQKLIYCEEAIEMIDLAIEYKNRLICDSIQSREEGHVIKQSGTTRILMEQIQKFNENEIRSLLQKYFERVVDLRSTSKKLECQVLAAESENEELLQVIQNLSRNLQRIRFEAERRVLSMQEQHEDKLQLMMRYLSSNDGSDSKNVVSHVIERSKQAALALQVAQGSKQIDKRNLIARFTRYARHETFPRQLQATNSSPQAKVTIQKNKLIIQQNKK